MTNHGSPSNRLKAQTTNSAGGPTTFPPPLPLAPFQPLSQLQMSKPSLMQAQELAWHSWLAKNGRHGDSSRDGKQMDVTSHGQNPLPLSSWPMQSSKSMAETRSTASTATTGSLSTAGTKDGHATDTSTLLFAAFTSSLNKPAANFTPDTYQVNSTRQTAPPEANFFIDATLPRTQRETRAIRAGTNCTPLQPVRPSRQACRKARELSEREHRGTNR